MGRWSDLIVRVIVRVMVMVMMSGVTGLLR